MSLMRLDADGCKNKILISSHCIGYSLQYDSAFHADAILVRPVLYVQRLSIFFMLALLSYRSPSSKPWLKQSVPNHTAHIRKVRGYEKLRPPPPSLALDTVDR